MLATVERETAKPIEMGSIRNNGDRVCFTFFEDEDGKEIGYGTVVGQVDELTAIVLVVLQGRRGELRDELEIPYTELTPHIPELKNNK